MSKAVESGRLYESKIFDKLNENTNGLLATENKENLAGCRSGPDIELFGKSGERIGVELKAGRNNPSWTQAVIIQKNGEWVVSPRSRLSQSNKMLMLEVLKKIEIKGVNECHVVKDNELISKLYRSRGCYYIQCEAGLFRTSESDPCGFEVPKFEPKCTKVRIRLKSHGKSRRSVTMSVFPLGVKKNRVSLESPSKFPMSIRN